MEDKAKIFVKIQDYNDIKDILGLMTEKIGQARELLEKINSIRAKEEDAIAKWGSDIKEIEEKLSDMNKSLSDV